MRAMVEAPPRAGNFLAPFARPFNDSRMDRVRWLATAVLLFAGCGEEVDDRPARWSYIFEAIIRPNCATASCHSGITATAGLQLEEAGPAHVMLAGQTIDTVTFIPVGSFVKPGDPHSKLLYLLRGDETWRMPPDQPLPEPDIALIESWILLGAKNDLLEGAQ
jgi:hypothetical protein